MKKYSVAVCVCAVLFFVGIHGGMREVFARAPGADENLAILQDIIRENECQAGMAFLGYASGPGFPEDLIHQALLTAAYSAREYLIMTTPYFVPSDDLDRKSVV